MKTTKFLFLARIWFGAELPSFSLQNTDLWNLLLLSCRENKISVFENGQTRISNLSIVDILDTDTKIGNDGTSTRWLNGSIDDFRIYNRALSVDEIEMLYRAESPNHFVDSAKDLEMIWVEPGTFTMGSPVTETDRVAERETQHQVTLTKGFYFGKYELTQAQYEVVMVGNDSNLSASPSNWPNNPNRPVETVSWDDTQVFLSRLNAQEATNIPPGWAYVLPTEAEWEYACRAGTPTAYSWGNNISASDANWNHGNDANQTEDVGQYSANPWGFFDMHGNVNEWVRDAYAAYSTGAQTDPFNETGSLRVIRGGAWSNGGPGLRSARRPVDYPSGRNNFTGFRLALRDMNKAPTDLNSTAVLAFQENQTVGTVIGEFNATDPDENSSVTYHFVNGENNNSIFTLDTNGTLKTATTFDYESNATSYTITVQVKDELNATTEGNFTVSLLDVNEPPYELYPTTALSIAENQPVGSVVGKFQATDPEGGEVTFSLGANNWETHNELFSLDANGTLRTAKQIDYETFIRWKKVRVNATDALGETVSELFRVVVEDVNDAPVVSGLGASEVFVQEGQVFKSGFTWDMTYGGMGNDTFKGMVPAHDGGYLIVGNSDSNKSTHKSDNSKGGIDYWLIKVNDAGELMWDKSYGGSEDDSCSGIIPTKDGNYLLFGSSKSPDNGDKSEPSHGSSDFWILKIDANGSKIWDKRFGGGAEDSCQFAMQLENGDFALGGSSRSGISGDKKHPGLGDLPDYWVLRVDENGSKLWDYSYGGEDWDVSRQMGVLPDGNWLIFGYSRSNRRIQICRQERWG